MSAALTLLVACLAALFGCWGIEDGMRLYRLQQLVARVKGTPEPSRRRLIRPKRETDLGLVALEVAARLRAGAPARAAWQQTWQRIIGGSIGEVGDDGVPAALKRLEATSPAMFRRNKHKEMAETARILATSCRFSAHTGAPIAEVLEQSGQNLGLIRQARGEQKVAFAGPRLSVRILAALPLGGMLLAAGIGANPLAWFTSSILALLIGILGVSLFAGGVLISQRWVAQAQRETRGLVFAPFMCDLAGAGLACGLSIPSVLAALGQASGSAQLQTVSAELVLGAPWDDAWDPLPADAKLLKAALQPAWQDGVSPTTLLATMAKQTRENQNLEAREAAGQLGVKLAIPLAGMLLPAFVLLSIVPIVVTLLPTLGI